MENTINMQTKRTKKVTARGKKHANNFLTFPFQFGLMNTKIKMNFRNEMKMLPCNCIYGQTLVYAYCHTRFESAPNWKSHSKGLKIS